MKERVIIISRRSNAQAFDAEQAYALVETHFGAQAIEANGAEDGIVLRVLGGLLLLWRKVQKSQLGRIEYA